MLKPEPFDRPPEETQLFACVLPHGQTAACRSEALIESARSSAESAFDGHLRKAPAGSSEPARAYFNHLEAVAKTLERYGFDAEVIAAGYMHDHIEDRPESWSRDRIAMELTPRVAELVDWVTQQDKSLPWELRNERYAERLRSAPHEALAISAADKLSNLNDLLYWMEKGFRVEQVLKRGWQANSVKMHELAGLFAGKIPAGLHAELEEAIRRFDALGEGN